MDVIACYAVANEADHIADSIRSVKAYVDGFVVVDSLFETNPLPGTHSSDGTRDVVERLCEGMPLTYIESSDRLDEPRARNRYMEATRGSWILIIDGDEQLYADHTAAVRLFGDIRAGLIDSVAVEVPVYTVAVNFNGNAPDMTEREYEVNPRICTVGYQPRLVDNVAAMDLRYRVTGTGIQHDLLDVAGRFVRGDTVAPIFLINHHTRQSFAGYQNDYVWERAAIDGAKR